MGFAETFPLHNSKTTSLPESTSPSLFTMRLMIKDAPGTSTYAPIINIVIPKPTPANFINLLFLEKV